MSASPRDRVAVVGGGFSGAMLAARLAEKGVASALINRSADFGLGVAYSTPFDGHLLNVRSGRMSAVEDRPGDFVAWLEANHPERAGPDGFAPRRVYGLYVQARLKAVESAHPGLIERVVGEVAEMTAEGVRLSDGRVIATDRVVLATGNPAPKTAGDSGGRVISDPWAPGALERIGVEDTVAIIGTGLTMVDMAVWLRARGWRGRMQAVSRRGLQPRAHELTPDTPVKPEADVLEGSASQRLHAGRAMARQGDWRGVMEGLRPITAELWAKADLKTQARWVRHLRPWWDVHRHRIAPEIAAEIQALRDGERLTTSAGRVRGVEATRDGVEVTVRGKGDGAVRTLSTDWLIDCSGPGHDPARDPLTGPLIASGRARMDALRLGLDLDDQGHVISRDGAVDPGLFVLGPPARAAFWETIAVPDIRKRIEDVASQLAGDIL